MFESFYKKTKLIQMDYKPYPFDQVVANRTVTFYASCLMPQKGAKEKHGMHLEVCPLWVSTQDQADFKPDAISL